MQHSSNLHQFEVMARITRVDGSSMDVPFPVEALDEEEVRRTVTIQYVMTKVSNDWGMKIRNVTVLSAVMVRTAGA